MPGRWDEVRESHEREVKMTGVIELPIDSASAKVTEGHPEDEDEDYDIPDLGRRAAGHDDQVGTQGRCRSA